jgi:hypothetical protein
MKLLRPQEHRQVKINSTPTQTTLPEQTNNTAPNDKKKKTSRRTKKGSSTKKETVTETKPTNTLINFGELKTIGETNPTKPTTTKKSSKKTTKKSHVKSTTTSKSTTTPKSNPPQSKSLLGDLETSSPSPSSPSVPSQNQQSLQGKILCSDQNVSVMFQLKASPKER